MHALNVFFCLFPSPEFTMSGEYEENFLSQGNNTEVYKISYPPLPRGKFIKSVREEYQIVTGDGNIMTVRKNITWKKGKGKHYRLPYFMDYWGCWEEGKRTEIWGRKSRFKIMGWGRISSCRALYTPLKWYFPLSRPRREHSELERYRPKETQHV